MFFVALGHLFHGEPFLDQRTGRAGLNALTAVGATRCRSPRLVHLAGDPALNPAVGHLPNVRSFDFRTDAHAPRAQHAAVVIQHEARMREIHRQPRIIVWIPHAADRQRFGERLQLAVAVRHAYGAKRGCARRGAVRSPSAGYRVSCAETVVTDMPSCRPAWCRPAAGDQCRHLHHSTSGRLHRGEPVHVTERRDLFPGSFRRFEGWSFPRWRPPARRQSGSRFSFAPWLSPTHRFTSQRRHRHASS